MTQYKTCTKCRQAKILGEFHKQPDTKDGFRGSCKACMAVYHRLRNQANPERCAIWRKSYAKAHPGKGAARSRAYRKAHPEKIATRGSAYKLANADKIILANREYRKAHPEVYLKAHSKRRADKAGNGTFAVTSKELRRIRRLPCTFCNANEDIHVDHVIPISKGGRHSIGNLQPLCGYCNRKKSGSFYMVFRHRMARQ